MDVIKNIDGTVTIALIDFDKMRNHNEELSQDYQKRFDELEEERKQISKGMVKRTITDYPRYGTYHTEEFWIHESDALNLITELAANVIKREREEAIKYYTRDFKEMSLFEFWKWKRR